VTLRDADFREFPNDHAILLFSYSLFELPKNITNAIEATARVVMRMKSIIRLALYYTRALLVDSALRDERAITAQWSI
jgi:hypothetical protein